MGSEDSITSPVFWAVASYRNGSAASFTKKAREKLESGLMGNHHIGVSE